MNEKEKFLRDITALGYELRRSNVGPGCSLVPRRNEQGLTGHELKFFTSEQSCRDWVADKAK